MDGYNTTFLLGFGLFSGAMLVSGMVLNLRDFQPVMLLHQMLESVRRRFVPLYGLARSNAIGVFEW